MESSSAGTPAFPERLRWTRTLKQEGEPVLTFSLCRPVFPDSGKTARIERYFSKLAERWQTRWETELFPRACAALAEARAASRPFDPWEAGLDYTVTLQKPPLLSLRLDVTERTGAARPLLARQGETWNCETGWPCPLRTLLAAKGPRWRSETIRQIQEQAAAQLASGESLLDPDCAQTIARSFDPDRFYLTEEGVMVFFPLYLLGPYAEGIPVFSLPCPETETQSLTETASGPDPAPPRGDKRQNLAQRPGPLRSGRKSAAEG